MLIPNFSSWIYIIYVIHDLFVWSGKPRLLFQDSKRNWWVSPTGRRRAIVRRHRSRRRWWKSRDPSHRSFEQRSHGQSRRYKRFVDHDRRYRSREDHDRSLEPDDRSRSRDDRSLARPIVPSLDDRSRNQDRDRSLDLAPRNRDRRVSIVASRANRDPTQVTRDRPNLDQSRLTRGKTTAIARETPARAALLIRTTRKVAKTRTILRLERRKTEFKLNDRTEKLTRMTAAAPAIRAGMESHQPRGGAIRLGRIEIVQRIVTGQETARETEPEGMFS